MKYSGQAALVSMYADPRAAADRAYSLTSGRIPCSYHAVSAVLLDADQFRVVERRHQETHYRPN